MSNQKKDLDEMIKEALANAPEIEDYTIKELAEITETPWPTTRWHLEMLEANVIKHTNIDRAQKEYLDFSFPFQ